MNTQNKNCRILAQGHYRNNDTRMTGLNNNDLIVGPSGAGKTRSYVKPNILQCNESMIIADTKGNLIREVGPVLQAHGYTVELLDFKDLSSTVGYNPLRYIRYDTQRGCYREKDIIKVASAICTVQSRRDPFWEQAAKQYLECMICYTLEFLPQEEHTLVSVAKLFQVLQTSARGAFSDLMREAELLRPDSMLSRIYSTVKSNLEIEKTHASICAILSEKLNLFSFDGAQEMYLHKNQLDFKDLGQKKMAVFVNISDTDRSMDQLVSLFYTQGLQALCDSADLDYPDCRLPVPVRFILDDFATNTYIEGFDNIISVIRSREIYVSVIIQSISQLEGLYGQAKASSIINNCDNCLYLGGQDVATATLMSKKANKTIYTMLQMPLGSAYLFTRGQAAQSVCKFDLLSHSLYAELPEAGAAALAPAQTALQFVSKADTQGEFYPGCD